MNTKSVKRHTKKRRKDQPVTEARFESAMTAIKQEFDLMREELTGVQGEVGGLRRVLEAVLHVVESIDQRLKETSDHTERIESLEKRVFRLETRG